MVTAVSSAATTSAATTSAQTTPKGAISSDFETFLLMLTTQMQNQDPLNPIDSADYAVQLATFSGVEQQVKTNDLLESLAAKMGLMGMTQLAGWVGMEARAATPAYYDGQPVTLAPIPAAHAASAQLVVTDATGQEVERGAIAVSADPVQWSGLNSTGQPYPAGLYSFRLESYDGNGALMGEDMVDVYARISEARGEANGTVLVLRGGVTVLSDDVTALREPQSS